MSDFAQYMKAQAETRAAMAEYNSAARGLELAKIRERLAQIKSQHEPLHGLIGARLSERDRLYAAALYVVTGRLAMGDTESVENATQPT